jgi:hypothetical protein
VNKDLYGKKIEIPEDVVGYLQQCHDNAKGANDSTEGYRRNKELRNSGYVTYQQLKRIKNFFDNFNGHENDLPFILNGGHYVKGWVDRMLDSMRDGISIPKKTKSLVLPNQYLQPHTKNDLTTMNRPTKSHSSKLEKYNLAITEDLKRINDLIKKII